jgi:hypothetical protein
MHINASMRNVCVRSLGLAKVSRLSVTTKPPVKPPAAPGTLEWIEAEKAAQEKLKGTPTKLERIESEMAAPSGAAIVSPTAPIPSSPTPPLSAAEGRAAAGTTGATRLYKLSVTTGSALGAGTDANVFVVLEGSGGKCAEQKLGQSSSNRHTFEAHQQDEFEISVAGIGELTKLHIRQDGSGHGSDWQLDNVIVNDVESQREHLFTYGGWLKGKLPLVLDPCKAHVAEQYTIDVDGTLGIHVVACGGRVLVAGLIEKKAWSLGVRAGHQVVRLGETTVAPMSSREDFLKLPALAARPLKLTFAGKKGEAVGGEAAIGQSEASVLVDGVKPTAPIGRKLEVLRDIRLTDSNELTTEQKARYASAVVALAQKYGIDKLLVEVSFLEL